MNTLLAALREEFATRLNKANAIDPGLINAFTLERHRNIGWLLENIVYLDLRRRQHKIFYYLTENRHEVDFVTNTLKGELKLYQVAL